MASPIDPVKARRARLAPWQIALIVILTAAGVILLALHWADQLRAVGGRAATVRLLSITRYPGSGDGQEWCLCQLEITNRTDREIAVSSYDIRMITRSGQVYASHRTSALLPPDPTRPRLRYSLNVILKGGGAAAGDVLFQVPADADPVRFEWVGAGSQMP